MLFEHRYVFDKCGGVEMFVKKVRTEKGIIKRGKYGIDRIDVDEENHLVTYYTAGVIFILPS